MDKIISIQNLTIEFNRNIEVVKNINLDVIKGKTTAIVGESGSGKTLSALSILKLLPNGAEIKNGNIFFNNVNLLKLNDSEIQKIRGNKISTIFQEPMTSLNPLHTINKQIEEIITTHNVITKNEAKIKTINLLKLSKSEIQKIRGNKISTIFQEPMTSLNPLHTINKQIEEIITTHNIVSKSDAKKKTINLLKEVGLGNIATRPKIYPYELSGGQRQRAMIAMSIANNPEVLIADEPTTALDVTIQLQILKLLKNIQSRLGMSLVFISHDLSVVKKLSDYIYVMKNGKIVEFGTNDEIFNNPKNEYTRELVSYQSNIKENKNFDSDSILKVEDLNVWYPIKKGLLKRTVDYVKAIKNVSFDLKIGESIGIVGESGSGKTSLILAILNLIESKGKIKINKKDLNQLNKKEMLNLRKEIQIVFQDPFSSLSPRMNIEAVSYTHLTLPTICSV